MKIHLLRSILAGLLLAALGNWGMTAPEEPVPRLREQTVLKRDRGPVVGLAFRADGKTLLSAYGSDGTIWLWDVASGKNTAIFRHVPEGRHGNILGMALSPDDKIVASCGSDKTIKLWDTASGKNIATFTSDREPCGIVFGPDGKTLSAIEKDALRVWDVAKRKELRYFGKMPFTPQSVTVSRRTKRPLLAVPTGKSFTLIDAVTGESILACTGHRSDLRFTCCFALDPEETMVASAGYDLTVRLWDRTSGDERATFEHPLAMNRCLAFSPDRKILISGFLSNHLKTGKFGTDGGFQLYEVPSGKVLTTLQDHFGITSLAFSPDGQLLATGCNDGFIKLWTIPDAWRKKGKK